MCLSLNVCVCVCAYVFEFVNFLHEGLYIETFDGMIACVCVSVCVYLCVCICLCGCAAEGCTSMAWMLWGGFD